MPKYRYTAKKSPTETVEDIVEADNRDAVLELLSRLGLMPLKVEEASGEKVTKEAKQKLDTKIPLRHLHIFTQQFASLMRSNVPILRALRVLESQTTFPKLKKIIAHMTTVIEREGQGLSETMQTFPKAFTPDYVNLIRAGEVGGALDTVLDRLAEKTEREDTMRSQLQSAMIYPIFVGLVGLVTIIFLMTFVMPKIIKVITGFGGDLPLVTKMLIALTGWMSQPLFWGVFILVGGTIFFLSKRFITAQRVLVDEWMLKIPIIGSLIQRVNLVRYCRSLGLLLDHGVLMLQALDAATPVVTNHFMKRELMKLPATIKEGGTLTEGMNQLEGLTPFLIQTISIGEESGKLGGSMAEIADYYEREVGRLMQVCAGLMEPFMILTIGVIIGFIVMAVLIPIFQISVIAR